jgi:hypothetical protein
MPCHNRGNDFEPARVGAGVRRDRESPESRESEENEEKRGD